ncbi:putative quinol monooxygenase [Altererythrobacter sp. H2]|uniref:putative quinol monooxygenase n=1 Tax=Altererythrobacter sp. H2 TaxID=3108391 RepID=UPI000BDB34B0|nr:putative quinol monooxygenase [Altererythrobacter sp. H2]OZA94635.1 MAG: antibiotic biosynthesis monooxygenase [Erythrobacter sp. 34-65-8]WRK97195.1 putative quinol monooxygenase [Altererythrobacter sp. H2]
MLIVLAKATIPAGALDAVRGAIATMVAASQAEEGCLAYSFTSDVLDPGTMHIVEKWRDEDALKFHFSTPHMAAFQAAIAGTGMQVTEALKYETGEGASLF